MNMKTIWILITMSLFLFSCSNTLDKYNISVSGSIDLSGMPENPDGPIFIAILNDNLENIQDDFTQSIIEIVSVDESNYTFTIDLSEKGVAAGDTISIIAFIDNDFTNGVPNLNEGDFVGFYVNDNDMSTSYVTRRGSNSGLVIHLNREFFSFEATITGTLNSTDMGELTLVAYAGEINSMDFSNIDFDYVVGFTKIQKNEHSIDYRIEILPYGFNVPIENVYLLAILDKNGNGIRDAGDKVGFFSDDNDMPLLLTVNQGLATGVNVELSTEIPEPSGYEILLNGTITLPDEYTPTDSPVFVIVTNASDPGDMDGDSLSDIKNFVKLEPGQTEFEIDLSNTSLRQNDDVMVIALLDTDFTAGFPEITEGDYIGFYVDEESMSTSYTLQANNNLNIDINRYVFSFDAEITGTVNGTDNGDLTIIAYAGEINSLDFTNISFDDVIGYTNLEKETGTISYNLNILPYGYNVPIENVYLLAFLDVNRNKIRDAGDKVGFYSNENGLPKLLTINEGVLPNIDVNLSMEIPEPSGYTITMSGTFDVSDAFNIENKPIFIMVAKVDESSDPGAIMGGDLSALKYFYKISQGANSFEFDLSATDLVPDDNVMIIALCDNNDTAGFPNAGAGDYIGYYQNSAEFLSSISLVEGSNSIVPSGDWDFEINKIMYDHDASIIFSVDDTKLNQNDVYLDPNEHFTAIAVQKAGVNNGTEITSSAIAINMDYFVGTASVTVPQTGNTNATYEMNILPAIYHDIIVGAPFAINDVYIFVIFDGNFDGTTDQNGYLGYYWETYLIFFKRPKAFEIIENTVNYLDKDVILTTIIF